MRYGPTVGSGCTWPSESGRFPGCVGLHMSDTEWLVDEKGRFLCFAGWMIVDWSRRKTLVKIAVVELAVGYHTFLVGA